MASEIPVAFWVNGESVSLAVGADEMLSDVLRYRLGLTGTKIACQEDECGSCTVLLEDEAVLSCNYPAIRAAGKRVRTIEGLARGGALHPLQEAFIRHGAVQCGFCIPGQLMTAVGLSPALGTFLAGVVLANSEFRHELESDIEPFKGLLLGLFFIAVGASVDFGLIAARPGMVAALVVLLVVVKIAVLASLGFVFRMRLDQNLLFAFALSQVGEFAFVLLSFASQQGVLAPPVTSPLVAVVALSMALTPLLLLVNDRFVRPRFETAPSDAREADAIHEENEVIIAGFGRFGTIVGRLLRANGVGTTVLDVDADKIDLLRRIGLKVFYGDASRTDLLKAAGAPKARLLVLAVDDPGKTLELVHLARRHFPHLTILARAADRSDAYELIDAGVTHIYRETLDTSLRVGVDALRLLGFRGYQAQRAARQFFRHDEESVRLMTSLRGDRARYVSLARERIADLERTLLADLEDSDGLDRDAGWDAESLRDEVRALSGAVKEL